MWTVKSESWLIMSYVSGNFYALTDIGLRREQNEDFVLTKINAYGNVLLMVADGMGGRNKGDYASKYLLHCIADDFEDLPSEMIKEKTIVKWLYKSVNKANRKLYNKSKFDEKYKGMGTTLSLVFICDKRFYTVQVGDSRIYMLDKDRHFKQLSEDQNYMSFLRHAHKINEQEAKSHKERHKITNAVGLRYNCNAEINSYEYHNESFLLCSDGLYNNVPDSNIEAVMKSKDMVMRKCEQLINFGNANGGSDNMAVVIWESN